MLLIENFNKLKGIIIGTIIAKTASIDTPVYAGVTIKFAMAAIATDAITATTSDITKRDFDVVLPLKISDVTMTPESPTTSDITAPAGLVIIRKTHGRIATTQPVGSPKRRAASRQKTPDGSYFKNEAVGKIGISMKLVAIESATKKAETAICFVFHLPPSVE